MNKNKILKIEQHAIGLGKPCFIAAEIGINHNGDMELARQMINAAAEAGADGVKFQNYYTSDFIDDKNLTYTYINNGQEVVETQWEMFTRCELSEEQLVELKSYCDEAGVVFFSTPTSEKGVSILESLNSPLIKNGSDFLTNLELIELVAKTKIPFVISTGMATIEEIDDAVNTFKAAGGEDLILLHCTSAYPTPKEEINLNRITALSERYDCHVGFSDHSEGNTAAQGSVVLGACFIEKHFTLDKNLPGPDHRFSMDPAELRELVNSVREMEAVLGNSDFGLTASEMKSHIEFRLSCVANGDIPSGATLTREQIVYRRPGSGIPPKYIDELLGKVLKHDVRKGHIFSKGDFDV